MAKHIDPIPYDYDPPCRVCGLDPAGSCICPECPVCGAQGDPKCYGFDGHGLFRVAPPQSPAGYELTVGHGTLTVLTAVELRPVRAMPDTEAARRLLHFDILVGAVENLLRDFKEGSGLRPVEFLREMLAAAKGGN
jgi:hypothetical protein